MCCRINAHNEVSIDEVCAVILHNKLPNELSDTIKRSLKEEWLNVDLYALSLMEEICTLDSRSKTTENSKQTFSASAKPTAAFAVNTVKAGKKDIRRWV